MTCGSPGLWAILPGPEARVLPMAATVSLHIPLWSSLAQEKSARVLSHGTRAFPQQPESQRGHCKTCLSSTLMYASIVARPTAEHVCTNSLLISNLYEK